MSDTEDDNVEQAVRRLLRATQDFTHAYDEWVHSPRVKEQERRDALDEAERRLTLAKKQVVFAQIHKD